MSTVHSNAVKISHATDTRTALLAEGDPILKVLNSAGQTLLEVDPIELTVLGAGTLEDWQFEVDETPISETAILSGTPSKIQLCDGNGDMVVEVPATGLVTPLTIVSGTVVQVDRLIYSAV